MRYFYFIGLFLLLVSAGCSSEQVEDVLQKYQRQEDSYNNLLAMTYDNTKFECYDNGQTIQLKRKAE